MSAPTISAIPTRYAGVQFRSRLEARWAAMFDLLGWSWEYEPIDLPGWIPDFRLHGPSGVLVEVTPVSALEEHREKMFRAGAPDASLPESHQLSPRRWIDACAGYDGRILSARELSAYISGFESALARMHRAVCLTESIEHEDFRLGFGNVIPSNRRFATTEVLAWADAHPHPWLRDNWREAGNRVKWKGAGARP